MFGLTIRMRVLVNLTLLLYFKIQKHNQIRAKPLKVTTKCFFDHAVKILKYHSLKKMFGLAIKMTLAALVQHKTKICSVD